MIKLIQTKEGTTAVLKNDTHLSRWVEEHGSIRTDGLLDRVLPLIEPGFHVIDAGAALGDWTVPLAKAVGPTGAVWACEPNPAAFACLMVNVRDYPHVRCINQALSNEWGIDGLNVDENVGAAFVTIPNGSTIPIIKAKVDDYFFGRLDFIKIDVEGSERRLLDGAKKTIEMHRPFVLCEINAGALERFGNVPDDVVSFFASRNYRMEFIEPHHTLNLPMVDVFFFPK